MTEAFPAEEARAPISPARVRRSYWAYPFAGRRRKHAQREFLPELRTERIFRAGSECKPERKGVGKLIAGGRCHVLCAQFAQRALGFGARTLRVVARAEENVRERHRTGALVSFTVALDIFAHVGVRHHRIARIARQREAQLLAQQPPDHDVVVETQPQGFAIVPLFVLGGIEADDFHLLQQTQAHARIARAKIEAARLAFQQLVIGGFVDEARELGTRRSAPVLTGEVIGELRHAIGGEDNRGALHLGRRQRSG